MLGLWFFLGADLRFVCWCVPRLVVGFCLLGVFVCHGEKLHVYSISGQGSACTLASGYKDARAVTLYTLNNL